MPRGRYIHNGEPLLVIDAARCGVAEGYEAFLKSRATRAPASSV